MDQVGVERIELASFCTEAFEEYERKTGMDRGLCIRAKDFVNAMRALPFISAIFRARLW